MKGTNKTSLINRAECRAFGRKTPRERREKEGERERAGARIPAHIDCFPLCNARVNGIAYFSAATVRIVKAHLHRVRVREWE